MSALRLAVRLGAITVTSFALILPAAAVATASTATGAHKGILPPKNPTRSLPPKPFFLRDPQCANGKDGQRCNSQILKATTRARKLLEKLGGMRFSVAAYDKLTPIEQLFVTVNLERTARGKSPAVVLTRSLDKVAQEGANKDEDPPLDKVPHTLPGGGQFIGLGGNWAGGWGNALGSNYAWMYDDGLGSDNGDCKPGRHAGLLGPPGQHPRHVQHQGQVRRAEERTRARRRSRDQGQGVRRQRDRVDGRRLRAHPDRCGLQLGPGQEATAHQVAGRPPGPARSPPPGRTARHTDARAVLTER